jgi:hypothetical protein
VIPHSALASDTLRRSHSIDTRVTAFSSVFGSVTNLPVVSGSVTADMGSQVRRTATVGIGLDTAWPASPYDVLSPLGSHMMIEYGIVLPTGRVEYLPLIWGPITSVRRKIPVSGDTEAVSVTVSDRSLLVAQARFDQPTQTVAGATTVAEITRLITDVLPNNAVQDQTGSTKVAPVMELDRERWNDGVEKLADSIGAEVFCDQISTFIIRPEPTVADPVVWTVRDNETGVLISEDDEFNRDLVYNRVVASGQRTDGTPPVFAIASDTNLNSPTNINGPFGIKTRFHASPLLTTVPQCQSAANSLLARVTGHHLQVSLTAITNPTLDAGDVIRVIVGDNDDLHVIESVSTPLTPGDTQQIKARTLTLPEESVA